MKTLLSWSSGKDSAWTLHVLRRDGSGGEIGGLLTSLNESAGRVSMHGVREAILDEGSREGGRVPLPEREERCLGRAREPLLAIGTDVLQKQVAEGHGA